MLAGHGPQSEKGEFPALSWAHKHVPVVINGAEHSSIFNKLLLSGEMSHYGSYLGISYLKEISLFSQNYEIVML